MNPSANLSRQRLWQQRMRKLGRCQRCGKHSGEWAICNRCAASDAARGGHIGPFRRYPRPSAWRRVNWSLSNIEIAKKLRVGMSAVEARRKALDPNYRKGRPTKRQ